MQGEGEGGTAMARRASGLDYFGEHGVDEGLLSAALSRALAHGADWAELFFEHTVDHQLGLSDGAVNRASSSVRLGVGVRVVKGDQQGFAYTEELTRERVAEAAATAAIVARGPARAAPKAYEVQALPSRYRARIDPDSIALERKMPILRRAEELAFAEDPRIRKVRVGMSDRASAVWIVDSDGRSSFDLQPMANLSIGCTAIDGSERVSNGVNLAGREGFEFFSAERAERMAKTAVARTTFLFDAVPAPAGELPLVLAAGPAGILLHEAIGHGLEADANRKGISIFSERMNQRVAHDDVTIVDDATGGGARGAIHVDDEGTAGQRTVLVEGGVLRGYMHDRISAEHYGVEPTGNGRRQSFRHAPLPRMRSTYMLPGPREREEIIASVERGIYAEHFTNGQVMIGAGDFTFYIKTGYLIEGGKLTRPIKDTNIIGNGPEVLARMDMVAGDLSMDEGGWTCGKGGQSVPVSLGMPTVRVSAITVGGVNPGSAS
jgi:TldD protein